MLYKAKLVITFLLKVSHLITHSLCIYINIVHIAIDSNRCLKMDIDQQ